MATKIQPSSVLLKTPQKFAKKEAFSMVEPTSVVNEITSQTAGARSFINDVNSID
jgi:hypothetical protein